MIGGFFGEGAYKLFNVMGSAVICIALLVVFGIFLVGLSPAEAIKRLQDEMIPYYPLGVYKDID